MMAVELRTRAAEVTAVAVVAVAIRVPVTADMNADLLGAGDRRGGKSNGGKSSNSKSELSHILSSSEQN